MSFIVPIPPNPDAAQYKVNPMALSRAQYDWMLKTKGRLEQSRSLSVGVPIQSPVLGNIPYYAGQSGWQGQYLNNILVSGSNIIISGTATTTIALSPNAINSFPNRTAISGTSYSVQTADYLIAYTTIGSAGNTVNFPSPIGLSNRAWIIKDESGFAGTAKTITLQSTAGTNTYTFDGVTSKSINSAYGDLRIYSNNSQYFTF